jgi:hypothetical protein
MATKHPCEGLPKAAGPAFDAMAAGFEPRASTKTLAMLVEHGLIERTDEHIGSSAGPTLRRPRYSVPIPMHIQWCEWSSGGR